MTYETLELNVDEGGLARLVLNQPALGNPFNAQMCADMNHACSTLLARGDVRAVLLTANGKFFTVGGDINMFAKQLDTLPTEILQWTSTLHMGLARLKRMNAPLIASVHGICMGGGLGLALAHHHRRLGAAMADGLELDEVVGPGQQLRAARGQQHGGARLAGVSGQSGGACRA